MNLPTTAKVFKGYFDLIVLDAPCSEEGMFRKATRCYGLWSLDYPIQCASLQREFWRCSNHAGKKIGRLVYSTCTLGPEENERDCQLVCWRGMIFDLLPVEHINGMVAGIDLPETARMYHII